MKKLIAGNWKMNGTRKDAQALTEAIATGVAANPELGAACDFLVCPPFVYIPAVRESLSKNHAAVAVGAQDCSQQGNGAFTGDISPEMLVDTGCSHVILGHSERRQYHGETDDLIREKAGAAHESGLVTVICVGETEGQREEGIQEDIVGSQLEKALPGTTTAENTVIAYEPVWAIGTGKTATPQDVEAMHKFIREKLQERLADSKNMRILYGGSMKPENAAELLAVANVDGGLIGGASLKADQYLAIAGAAVQVQSQAA